MGVSRKVNNIKVVKKVFGQRQAGFAETAEAVDTWNNWLNIPPLTPYYNPNSMYETDILKKKDGSYYSFDEALEALKKYIGVEKLSLSFPNVLSYKQIKQQILHDMSDKSLMEKNDLSFLMNVLYNPIFEYDYKLRDYEIGVQLYSGDISARSNPFKGYSNQSQKMIDAGLLKKISKRSGNAYALTPLGITLSYLFKNYSEYTPANSPDFNRKIEDDVAEMLKKRTYDSFLFEERHKSDSLYFSLTEQSYIINTPSNKSLLFSHSYSDNDFIKYIDDYPKNFDEGTRSFDLLIASSAAGQKENEAYNQQINAVIATAIVEDNEELEDLYILRDSQKPSAYEQIIKKRIAEAQNAYNRVALEPIALIESKYYSNIHQFDEGITAKNLIFRSSYRNLPEVAYHKISLSELKKYLVANNLTNFNELDLSILPAGTDERSNRIPPILVITNKETGELLGMSNRMMHNCYFGDTRNSTYVKYDIYRSMNL